MTMRKAIHILSFAILLPLVSCVDEKAVEQTGLQAPVSALTVKSVNTAANALPGTLLVKFGTLFKSVPMQGHCSGEET